MNKTTTTTANESLPQPTSTPAPKFNLQHSLQAFRQKIKVVHVVAVVGVLSVFVGYLSVAPPTDLPNWPLYSLNARTWQFFERWVSTLCVCAGGNTDALVNVSNCQMDVWIYRWIDIINGCMDL